MRNYPNQASCNWFIRMFVSFQVWVFEGHRRRTLQILSLCVWTICCWQRGWLAQRKAVDQPVWQQLQQHQEALLTTPLNTQTTGPNSHRSDKSTIQNWKNMNRSGSIKCIDPWTKQCVSICVLAIARCAQGPIDYSWLFELTYKM